MFPLLENCLCSLTQGELEWPAAVAGTVHLLSSLQSEDIMAGDLGQNWLFLRIGHFFCYLLALLRERGSVTSLDGLDLDSHCVLGVL